MMPPEDVYDITDDEEICHHIVVNDYIPLRHDIAGTYEVR